MSIDSVQEDKNLIISNFERIKKLNHPNILKYIQIKPEAQNGKKSNLEENIDIVTEYCEGGSLGKLLEKFDFLEERLIKKYIKQILLGLEYLHANKIIHKNLKLSNVLVDKEGKVKVSDYFIFNLICKDDPDRIILYSTNKGKGDFLFTLQIFHI